MQPLVDEAARLFEIELSARQVAQMQRHADELALWNGRVNLTAITDPQEVLVRHFLDSLSVAAFVPLRAGMQVMDVGTGAGFPGLPLHILCPEMRLTLLDATAKKLRFLDHLIGLLELEGVRTLHARAEQAGQMPSEREAHDLVLARTVARMPVLAEYMLPLARVGGQCVAMKGSSARQELQSATRAIGLLGGRLNRIETLQLPGVAQSHHLVILDKVAPTPAAWPRQPGTPARRPL
ncbi:MAG: 16S rRNA (guanine(527)-N(7))-methyltransferase RsmG [Anaerolineaceae bacterium]|nr:16S rRNA (guanine(527)-N(7))-methyltransferase RsmG [Anaerolineaceae bacterium]